jgi:hypothetical protein
MPYSQWKSRFVSRLHRETNRLPIEPTTADQPPKFGLFNTSTLGSGTHVRLLYT